MKRQRKMKSLNEIIMWGMDREVNDLLPFPDGPVLNLGAGKKHLPGTIPLDRDNGWIAPILPHSSGTVAGAYAFHFLEHLQQHDALAMLKEIERVLMDKGSLIAVTPLAGTELSFQDLDHKSFWTEGTWRNLFSNEYYGGGMPRQWELSVHLNLIMGLTQRNLVLISQIVKRS